MEIVKESPEEYGKIRLGRLLIKKEHFILLISIPLSILFLIFGFLFKLYLDYNLFASVIFISFSIAFFPYLFYKTLEGNELKRIEENYPSFLRDLSEAIESGMTLPQALKHVSKINYGPLSKFINKLYVWLSWGIEFEEAFEKFNKYFEKLDTVRRANYIILESYREGGNMAKVLKTVADDLESIKELDKLRKAYISQQIFVLYVVFFIFIGLIIILKNVLAPMISQQLALKGEKVFGFTASSIDFSYFKFISALAILLEGITIAFVIGIAESGKLSSGLKHLIVTLTVSILAILIFILPEQVNLSLYVFPKSTYVMGNVKISGNLYIDAKPIDGKIKLFIIGPESVTRNIEVKNGKFEYEFIPTKEGNYTIRIIYRRGLKEYKAEDMIIVS